MPGQGSPGSESVSSGPGRQLSARRRDRQGRIHPSYGEPMYSLASVIATAVVVKYAKGSPPSLLYVAQANSELQAIGRSGVQ